MACIRIPGRRNINSLIRKIPYWKMLIGIRIMGLPKELLFIVYWRQKED
jgi:hypothetical protein